MGNRLTNLCDQIIEAGWLVCAVTVPLFFNIFSNRVFEPDKLNILRSIVLIMAFAWLVRYFTIAQRPSFSKRRLVGSSPLALPVLIFAAVYILATLLSVDPAMSFWGSYVRLQGLVTNLAYLALFFLVADRIRTRAQVDRLISVIIMTSVPISVYGLIQHLQLDPLPWGGDVTFRVTSTMGNAIFLAAYLIMVTPLTVARLVQSVLKLVRPISGSASMVERVLVPAYALVLALQLVTVLFTKSRGPWLGLAAGLFFMAILWLIRLRLRAAAVSLGGTFVALSIFVLLLNVASSPLESLKASSVYLERVGTIMDMQSGTNRVRTLIWFGDSLGKGAAGLITATPWRTLLGHGPESMYVSYGPYYPPDLAHLEARNAAPDRSHNDLLDSLVTMGFLGLFAYLLVLVRGFGVGFKALWQEQDLAHQGILVAILGTLGAHVIESLVGISIASTLTYTWLLLGCLASTVLNSRGDHIEAIPQSAVKPTSETRISRRRRTGRKDRAGEQKGPGLAQPRFRRTGYYDLVVYLVVTAVGTFFVLSGATSKSPDNGSIFRDPEPAWIVVCGYFWLVLGILSAAWWVRRPQPALGRTNGQAVLVASVIGLVAVLLPIKLFMGGVIGDMYFKKGLNASTAQRPDLAIAPYLTAVGWSPDEDFFFLYLGQAYLDLARNTQTEKPSQNVEKVSDLAKLGPVTQVGRENLVQAALVALKRAQDLNPLNTDHAANLARLYRLWGEMSADASVKRDKFTQSIEYYGQATSLSPNAAHLRAEWGLVHYLKGENDGALQQYLEALRLDQRYAPTYAYLGDLYRSAGDDEKAIENYQIALSIRDTGGALTSPMDTAVHAGLGEEYFRKNLFRESLLEAQKVSQAQPKDFSAHRNLAIIYRALGDSASAVEEARQALSLAPTDQKAALQAFVADLQASTPKK
ncbi:MAG: O-antigen ligase family protein [Dehalococcoidia bacterium]|nr:O-antigen ligase family protein [Dehalococcoidia bacterium]